MAFTTDCQFQDRYRDVSESFQREFNINVLDINKYRALRFIDRETWDKNESKKQFDPSLMYPPSPVVWKLWSRAEKALREIDESQLTIDDVAIINRMSVNKSVMSIWAVVLKGARPGKIRSKVTQMPPQFFYDCKKNSASRELVDFYKNFDVSDSRGRSLLKVSFHSCLNKKGYYSGDVRYLKSHKVPAELRRWIKTYNETETHEISPMDTVADLQRRFISIHPFGDGNGRTSRFLQDLYLTKWKLPLPASGDLQKDLETPQLQYRQNMKKAIETSLVLLENCLEQYRQNQIEGAVSNISENCKVL